ncbi:MAG: alpha-galactosidase [Clostridia bacterium]|nr:alpha-galactosidase [Clostridia bacterium]
MEIRDLIFRDNKSGHTGVSGFFSAYGSFGAVDGASGDIEKTKETESGYYYENGDFSAECVVERYENGVFSRRDVFVAKKPLTLQGFSSRFCLESGEYEVYTQSSSWQTESSGGWQKLVSGVRVSNLGIRTTDGAAPMIALKNKGSGRILVIHLFPNAAWEISASLRPVSGRKTALIVETGIAAKGLSLPVAAGEKINMPRLFVFEAKSEIDLDAWKLHAVYNRLYPRKTLPVIYNTWLNNFDAIDVDDVKAQAKAAAEIGVENFVIDAGWFGHTETWWNEIGSWSENIKGGFKGRLAEVGDYVRSLGMKFGLWLEPERALVGSDSYCAHPEFFIRGSGANAFADFANEKAREYITDLTLGLIEKYRLGCMKFDFNAALAYDVSGCGFYRYFQGVRRFIADVKEKYPDLYLTNCASGGTRMELENGIYYDSVWPSDNQSPLYGLRIYKETLKRLPPCHIEKWDVRRFAGGFPKYGSKTPVSLPISCNGATWDNLCSVSDSYAHAFLTGGPIGFSTDIAGYPEEEKELLKEHIRQFKVDREFYKSALVRILHDGGDITALQYSDPAADRVLIQVFSNVPNLDRVRVYPVLPEDKSYSLDGEEFLAKALSENGIKIRIGETNCRSVTLEARK